MRALRVGAFREDAAWGRCARCRRMLQATARSRPARGSLEYALQRSPPHVCVCPRPPVPPPQEFLAREKKKREEREAEKAAKAAEKAEKAQQAAASSE